MATVTNTGASTATGVYSAFGPDNSADVGCDPAHPQGSCDKYTTFFSSNPSPFFTDSTNYRYIHLKDQNGVVLNNLAPGQSGTFDVYYTASANGTANRPFTAASPDVPLGQQVFVQTAVGTVAVSTDPQMMPATVQPSTAKVGLLRKYHGEVYNDGPDTASGIAIGIQADSQNSGGVGFDQYETFNSSNPAPNPTENPDANGTRFISLPDIPAKSSITFDVFYTTAKNGFVQRNFFLRVPASDNDSNTSNNHYTVASSISDNAPDQLSATLLTVNGSSGTSFLVNDDPIVFEATQGDTKDRVSLKVQWASTVHPIWTDLDTGFAGAMVYNVHDGKYVLGTENYPIDSNVYFRAVASSPGKDDSASNEVGGFTIGSAKTHLPPTLFQIEGMQEQFLVFIAAYPLNFFAINPSQASGLAVRLQSSTTPEVEGSWTDVNGGNLTSLGSGAFNVRTGNYPAGSGIYFRTVASANNNVNSISNFVGPFQLTANTLPQVTITSPSGAGTDASPLQISNSAGKNFVFSATGADPNGSVQLMELFADANRKDSEIGSSASTTLNLSQGRHTLKAVATDNSEAKSYAEVVVQVAPAAGATSYSLSTSGDWNNAANWTPNGVPGPLDTANTGSNTVSIAANTHITVGTLMGGNLTGVDSSSMVTVTKTFSWTGGTISHATLEVASGAKGEIKARAGGPDFTLNAGTFINGGTITVDVDSFLTNNTGFHGKSTGSSLLDTGELSFNAPSLSDQTSDPILLAIIQSTITKKLQGLAAITIRGGTCHLNGVKIDLSGSSGRPGQTEAASNATSGLLLDGGVLDFGPLNQAGTVIGDVTVNTGTVTGSGAVIGNLTNNGGLIAPGHSSGILSVTGNYTQGANGTLLLEVAGNNANGPQYDQLQVGGVANLAGTLDVQASGGFTPQASDTFVPLSYGSTTGNFTGLSSNASLNMGTTGATVSILAPNPPTGRPANISTRMKVLTNEKVLIGGFIITGPNGSTKKVLIRGMGPTLGKLNVPGSLSDPLIELHYPDMSVVTNDDWGQAANHAQIPVGFQPDPKESALLVDLAPGAYTVIEKGAHGETGIGLTEIYDFDGSNTVVLANISTRGFIDTDDNVMIGGFIVDGTEPAQILVRGTGPSLAQYINGVMADPVLELHDGNGNVFLNDDWRETQQAEIQATTIPPSDNKEPAILATLVPGSYTAIVRGKDNTTGIGLVEAYKIK